MRPVEVVLALALAAALFWISYNHVRFERFVTCVLDLAEAFARLQDDVEGLERAESAAAKLAFREASDVWEREYEKVCRARDAATAALRDHFLAQPPEDSFIGSHVRSLAGITMSDRTGIDLSALAKALVRLDDGLRRAREAADAHGPR